jgi:hypothetical protein
MKKLILLLSLTFCLNAFSQIEKPITKGNIILTGGASIQSNNIQTSYDPTSPLTGFFVFSLTPGFSYFVKDDLAIGLNTNISFYKQGSTKYYSLGVGPNIRYYFKNGIFIKADAMIATMGRITTDFGSNYTSRATNFSFVPGLGYSFFLNQKVALDPCLSYMFILQRDNSQNFGVGNVLFELKFSIFL